MASMSHSPLRADDEPLPVGLVYDVGPDGVGLGNPELDGLAGGIPCCEQRPAPVNTVASARTAVYGAGVATWHRST